jgi:ribosome-associated toxin RatA of RatAB toxin-antitoxin module
MGAAAAPRGAAPGQSHGRQSEAMKRFTEAVLLASLILPTGCIQASGPVRVEVKGTGANSYAVRLQMTAKAPADAVFAALSDFGHHAEYVPHLTRSAIVFRGLGYDVVDQEGKIRVLFWTFRMRVKQKVQPKPKSEIAFQALEGDFTELRGLWRLEAAAGGTEVECNFSMQPRRRVPGWAVRFATKRYLAPMVEALVRRAETHPFAPPLPAPGQGVSTSSVPVHER